MRQEKSHKMLIHSASQLLTIPGGPQRGANLGSLGIIPDGAVLIRDKLIADAGDSRELLSKYPKEEPLDISGHVLMPGFVDPHTHLIWAGDRAAEFEMRLQGKSYLEIMEAGGGIQATVHATRAASDESLLDEARKRAGQMLAVGTTTAEAKSGYGLHTAEEMRLMDVLMDLKREGPLEIIPTFLGAHAIPEEFRTNPDKYVSIICSQMLPKVKKHWESTYSGQPLPFVDVFCDKGAFNLDQSRRILNTARSLGFPLKIHADEFKNLGGASLAADLGANALQMSPALLGFLNMNSTTTKFDQNGNALSPEYSDLDFDRITGQQPSIYLNRLSPFYGLEGYEYGGYWYFTYEVGARFGLNTETAKGYADSLYEHSDRYIGKLFELPIEKWVNEIFKKLPLSCSLVNLEINEEDNYHYVAGNITYILRNNHGTKYKS